MDLEIAALHEPAKGTASANPPLDLPDTTVFDVHHANREMATASPEAVVRWAVAEFGDGLALSSSFGAHSAAMLHLVTRIAPRIPVIFIDTGHLFPETYRFAEELRERFSLNLHVFSPRITAARQEATEGRLWEQGEQAVRRYLALNKVEPMQRGLQELEVGAWIAGLRASQTEHRRALRRVELQNSHVKIHPILDWTTADVDAYLARHHLPYHPLYHEGYRSIGGWHSTQPVAPDEDERAGRLLGAKRECGLHLPATDEENLSLTSSSL
jgi:phosphoadenosine phosphosulfate reductase